jgi:Tfp pilus assembly protein PilF
MLARLFLIAVFCFSLQAQEDPLAMPPEVQAFARRATGTHTGSPAKLRALIDAVFRSADEGGLGLTYDSSYTRTVAEVWRDRKANCLSLTAFYVGACRSIGIDAKYADSMGVNRWRRVGNLVRYERHVVAVVQQPAFQDLVADFLPEYRRGVHFVSVTSEPRVRALFYSNRAVELLESGESDQALIAARRSIEVDPSSGVGWNILGVLLRYQGHQEESKVALLKALEIDPKDGVACGNLEGYFREQGNLDEAAKYRQMSLNLRKNDPYFSAFLGREAWSQGNLQEAESRLKNAIKLFPQEPDFYLLLAQIEVEQGQPKSAIKALEQARRWAVPEERERFDSKLAKLRQS